MAIVQGYSDVKFLRGGHLSCHSLRKAPRTCQSDFNYLNKNNCKGKMFWLTRLAAGFSGFIYQIKQKYRLEGKNGHDLGENTQIQKKVDAKFMLKKSLLKVMSVSTPDQF